MILHLFNIYFQSESSYTAIIMIDFIVTKIKLEQQYKKGNIATH